MKKLLAVLLSVMLLCSVASAFAEEAELVWWGWTPGGLLGPALWPQELL